ncbi:uncharacterized protein LOC108670186 [Hyalella azteca]|uniref:Uncharacterized protein LOC108670186 n=1 Tax=Hyalella azteca TaxID=294128 RepID=A0A8B7NIF3_HYAAZ|nr:uncharacterized protein LOC108670186 [Hyalella azteca]
MDGLLAICHFCELHGPRVVFCTQAHQQLPTALQLQQARECSSLTSEDECAACQAFIMENGCLVTEGRGIYYVSSRVPLNEAVAALLKSACFRSLSCEVCPGGEGCVYFGDDVRGHVLSYCFSLRDVQARGLKRWYSFLVLVKERAYLLSAWTFFVQHLKNLVDQLQQQALQVFNKEGGSCNKRVQTELPHRHIDTARGLPVLVACSAIWQRLHTAHVWLMAAAGARLVEVIGFVPHSPQTLQDEGVLDDPDECRNYRGGQDKCGDVLKSSNSRNSLSKSCSEDGMNLVKISNERRSGIKVDSDLEDHFNTFISTKTDSNDSRGAKICFKDVTGDRSVSRDNSNILENCPHVDCASDIEAINEDFNMKMQLDAASDYPNDTKNVQVSNRIVNDGNTGNSEDSSFTNNKINLQSSGTGVESDKFEPEHLPPTIQHFDNNRNENMFFNDVNGATNAVPLDEVLSIRELCDLLAVDQFGLLLQHLYFGFPLVVRYDEQTAYALGPLIGAVRNCIPKFLWNLVSVDLKSNEPNLDYDMKYPANTKTTERPDTGVQRMSTDENSHKNLAGNVNNSYSIQAKSQNYFRLPNSPSIEAYDALEMDTLVLLVSLRSAVHQLNPPLLIPKNTGKVNNFSKDNASQCMRLNDPRSDPSCFDRFPKNDVGCTTLNAATPLPDPANNASCSWTNVSNCNPSLWLQQVVKTCTLELQDVSGRPYDSTSLVTSASGTAQRRSCSLVRTITSACSNPALRDDTLQLTVHHALSTWCNKAKLWEQLLTQQQASIAANNIAKTRVLPIVSDQPGAGKAKTTFGFSLSSPQWPKFLSSSRQKRNLDQILLAQDNSCNRYEAVGLYPNLREAAAFEENYHSLESHKHTAVLTDPNPCPTDAVRTKTNMTRSSRAIAFNTGDNRTAFQATCDSSLETMEITPITSLPTDSRITSNSPVSISSRLTGPAVENATTSLVTPALLMPTSLKAKTDTPSKSRNTLYPSITEEDISKLKNASQFYPSIQDLHSETAQHFTSSSTPLGASGHTSGASEPPASSSLAALSNVLELPESLLQKILLAVGATESDVSLLQCWAFHLMKKSSFPYSSQ